MFKTIENGLNEVSPQRGTNNYISDHRGAQIIVISVVMEL